jgi:hypothetical protein
MRGVKKKKFKSAAQQHYSETVLSEAQYSGGCRLCYKSNQAGEAPHHVFTFTPPDLLSPSSL